jgi:predicted DNA-binding transcriptional regulator
MDNSPPTEGSIAGARQALDRVSEHNRGSIDRWLEMLSREQKTEYLFELEMWVKCFDRFFRVKNHPMSEQEARDIVRRDFSEELKIVRNVSLRMSYLCTELMTEERADLNRFDRYIEGYLKREFVSDGFIEKLMQQPTPEDSLSLLTESLADLRAIIDSMARLPKVEFATFTSIGKIINREIKRCRYIDLLIAHKFKPQFDRIENPRLAAIIKGITNEQLRTDIAKIFLELFRLLRYLHFIADDLEKDKPLKNSLLIFSLINSEVRLLLEFIENKMLKLRNLQSEVYAAVDACAFSLGMELKKIFGRELVGFVYLRQAPPIYAKVENSHGLLRDSFQQSIVALAQVFDPDLLGTEIFASFQTKLEQSLQIRNDIWRLLVYVRRFQESGTKEGVAALIERIALFRDASLKYLMYKDWDSYEAFLEEIIVARTLEEVGAVLHRFSVFLETLLGQVNMRMVLADHPFRGRRAGGRAAGRRVRTDESRRRDTFRCAPGRAQTRDRAPSRRRRGGRSPRCSRARAARRPGSRPRAPTRA